MKDDGRQTDQRGFSHLIGKWPNRVTGRGSTFPAFTPLLLITIFVAASFMHSTVDCGAEVLCVPDSVATIVDALDQAQSGDTILVKPGNYDIAETLTMQTPNVTLLSEEPLQAVLTGQTPVEMIRIEADSCLVEGFCIFNLLFDFSILVQLWANDVTVQANFFESGAAGIDDQGSNTSVLGNEFFLTHFAALWTTGVDCRFEGNTVRRCGGGVNALGRGCLVRGNTFLDSRSESDTGGSDRGGGVYAVGADGTLVIEYNEFARNWTSDIEEPGPEDIVASGGGIYIDNCELAIVRHNRFLENQATRGAGIYTRNAEVVIDHNLFVANYDSTNFETNPARGDGGGAFLDFNTHGVFRNNTIVRNTAANDGGGVYVVATGIGLDFSNNIVVENESSGSGIFCQVAAPSFACNDTWANSGGNYGGVCDDPTGMDGNISLDPLFCLPDSTDYTLSSMSPCTVENAPEGCGLIGAFPTGCPVSDIPASRWDLKSSTISFHPNPTTGPVEFDSVVTGTATLLVYDARGRLIRRWNQAEDAWPLYWEGRDNRGHRLAVGVYFVVLSQSAGHQVRKMHVVR